MIEEILAADQPHEIFGELPDDRDEAYAELQQKFRSMAREVHPDANTDPKANDAFTHLVTMNEAAKRLLNRGTYGTAAVVIDTVTIQTKRHAYKIRDIFAEGETSNVYVGDDEDGSEVMLKIVRSTRDNDLLGNEATMLKKILGNKDTFDLASPYLPAYIETFGYAAPGERKKRQAIAYARQPGLVTLEDVREIYETGVHPKDMAWMMRRLLMAVGFCHVNGIVHGGIVPSNILIHPEQHGLVLADFKYATEGEPIKAISSQFKDFYPAEVLAKEKPLPGTDIYMAVECMKYVIGEQSIPKPLSAFFNGCQQKNPRRRPQDAWDLKDEFDKLLEDMWGPRRFRPFTMQPVQ